MNGWIVKTVESLSGMGTDKIYAFTLVVVIAGVGWAGYTLSDKLIDHTMKVTRENADKMIENATSLSEGTWIKLEQRVSERIAIDREFSNMFSNHLDVQSEFRSTVIDRIMSDVEKNSNRITALEQAN